MTGRFLSIESSLAELFRAELLQGRQGRTETQDLQPTTYKFFLRGLISLSIDVLKERFIGCRCSVIGFSLSAEATTGFAKPGSFRRRRDRELVEITVERFITFRPPIRQPAKTNCAGIEFEMEDSGERLRAFAPARKESIKGMALADDIENARQQWAGKTLWVKAMMISSYDEQNDALTMLRVRKYAPFKVVDVAPGWDEEKPVRFTLQTPDGKRGFVDLNLSGAEPAPLTPFKTSA